MVRKSRGLLDVAARLTITQESTRGDCMKLTRAQVKEGLDTIPMKEIILGVHGAKKTSLTRKQLDFAKAIASGDTKAGAYRKAYNSTGKPETQSKRGQELMKTGAVSAQVEAFEAAFEAMKYTTPAHLRALTIHQLTQHALNEGCPPAQRIKALELIGKMTEVSLFTERREIIQVTDSSLLRERLMETLRTITTVAAVDVTDTTAAESLLAELAEPTIEPQASDEVDSQETGPGSNEAETPTPTPHPPPSA